MRMKSVAQAIAVALAGAVLVAVDRMRPRPVRARVGLVFDHAERAGVRVFALREGASRREAQP